ncbi:MAG: hypothetical protein P8012_15490 [Desulfobacterales bacterium]
MKHIILGIFVLSTAFSSLQAQSQTWEIITVSEQPYPTIILHSLSNDTLTFKAYGQTMPISIDSIKYLKRKKPSFAGVGILFGMTAGTIIGLERSKESSDNNPLFTSSNTAWNTGAGMFLGGAAGFILGEALGADEIYDLRKRNHQEKVELLSQLIQRNQKNVKH